MRVNIDSKALKDPRFKRMGKALGIHWREALGLCIETWMYASEQRSEFLSSADVDAIVDRERVGAAMLEADLAELDGDRLRLRGVRKRIGFLVNQAERGRAGGKASAAARTKRSITIEANASANGRANGQRPLKRDPSDQAPAPALALHLDPVHCPEEPPSPHALVVGHFDTRFRKENGAAPTWGPKEGKLVKELLRKHTPDEIIRRIDIMFDAPPEWPTSQDIGTLSQHFDKFAKRGRRPPIVSGSHPPATDFGTEMRGLRLASSEET